MLLQSLRQQYRPRTPCVGDLAWVRADGAGSMGPESLCAQARALSPEDRTGIKHIWSDNVKGLHSLTIIPA